MIHHLFKLSLRFIQFMKITDITNMFGQLKGMQEQFSNIQEEAKKLKFSAETGGGIVKATVDGEGLLTDLKIDPSLLEKDEMHILSDLIKKAVQEAQKESGKGSKERMANKLKEITGGLNIPGLDQFMR